jgi:hypothetical protein
MWRFFSSLCILSIVAFLGAPRGQAELSERSLWRSAGDGMNRSHGACSTPAGRVSAIPPPAAWTPPEEIASGGALVWRSPAEIGVTSLVAAVTRADGASTRHHFSKWAPPSEIASEPVEHRSAAIATASSWRPPEEIAARIDVVDPEDLVSSISAPRKWAAPAEIAESATGRRENAARASALVWTPPREIAGRRAERMRQPV